MKKIVTLLLTAMSVGAIWGQKTKVAIYAEDKSGKNYSEFACEYLEHAIAKRGTYEVVNQTGAFLQQINREQGTQRSETASETQIAKLGKQSGFHLVCAVRISAADGDKRYYISARLIDVASAKIERSISPKWFSSDYFYRFEQACENIATSFFDKLAVFIEPEMVFVQGGTFTMGCTDEQGSDCDDNEKPQHDVTLSDYHIGKYEVTQAQWEALMGNNPSTFKGGDSPVENVSWDDIPEFISRLNAATGKNYRLPTEAEWEYAARGGNKSQGYKYSGGNNIYDVACFEGNSGDRTYPVGRKKPNELGIYDMSGNVWEWCLDWYDSYSATAQRDPVGASVGSYRVCRGGSWSNRARFCRVAFRSYFSPDSRSSIVGFRVVLP
jgi:formylglycine-generating enzyme required for sulfatase activity